MITLNILEVVVVKNFIHLYSEFISSTKNSNNINLLTCIYINTKNGNNLNSFTCIYINSVYDSSFFLIISHFRSYFISTFLKMISRWDHVFMQYRYYFVFYISLLWRSSCVFIKPLPRFWLQKLITLKLYILHIKLLNMTDEK